VEFDQNFGCFRRGMIVVLICNNPEVIRLRKNRDIPNVLKKSQKWKISELSSLDQLFIDNSFHFSNQDVKLQIPSVL